MLKGLLIASGFVAAGLLLATRKPKLQRLSRWERLTAVGLHQWN